MIEPLLHQVVMGTHASGLFEQPTKVVLANVKFSRHRCQRQILTQVFVDVVDRQLQHIFWQPIVIHPQFVFARGIVQQQVSRQRCG